jgi:hypothetical protein
MLHADIRSNGEQLAQDHFCENPKILTWRALESKN